MDVREMASLGGKAAAKKLGKRKRSERASKAGRASTAKISAKERHRRAKLAWVTRRKNAEQKKLSPHLRDSQWLATILKISLDTDLQARR